MDDAHWLTLLPQQWHCVVPVADTLLQAAAAAGIVLPSSCRNGTCRTCLCQLEAGQIHYRIDWPGLSAEEKQQGWILPCVALADSALTLRVPAARRISAVAEKP